MPDQTSAAPMRSAAAADADGDGRPVPAPSLAELADVGLVYIDATGRMIDANPRWCAMLGYTLDQIRARTLADVTDAGSMPATAAALEQLQAGAAQVVIDKPYRRDDGRLLAARTSIRAVRDAAGRCVGAVATVTDWTEYADARRASGELASQLDAMFAVPALGMAHVDPMTRRFVRVNAAMTTITGYSEVELAALAVDDLNHPDDQARDRAAYERSLHGRGGYEIEKRYLRKDGTPVWVLAVGNVVRADDGRALRAFTVVKDINQRKTWEQALKRSVAEARALQRHLETLSDTVPALISYIDTDFRYRSCNERYSVWFGLPRDRIIGQTVREVLGDEAWEAVRPRMEAALGGQFVEYEAELRYRSGGPRWVHGTYTPHRDENGQVVGMVVLVMDVSERKRLEADLRGSDLRLKAILDQLPIGVGVMDMSGRWTTTNPLLEQYVPQGIPSTVPERSARWRGWDADGKTVPPDRWPGQRSLRGETVAPGMEMLYRGDDGAEQWLRVSSAPLRDEAGTQVGATCVITDIDAIKRGEAILRESEQRFRTMADSSPIPIWVTDTGGRVQFINQAFARFFGVEDGALGARTDWEALVHPDDRDRYLREYAQAESERTAFRCECRVRGADGEWRWIASYAAPRFAADGSFLGFVGSSPDITERRAMEEALRAADRRKDEFLATLAHELRNPIAPIRYATALLAHGTDPAMLEQARGTIERQSAHLSRLLDDLLDLSRITRDVVELQREDVELHSVLHAAVENARHLVDARQQQLRFEVSGEPLWVNGDKARLLQIVDNLLGNACKYTPKGGTVVLRARAAAAHCIVEVADNGIGLAPEMLPTLFSLFGQVHPNAGGAQGGLGIGLAVVKRLVELHGGEVTPASPGLGRGSTFTVRLPRLPRRDGSDRPDASRMADRAALRGLRVLVVDDNIDAAQSLGMVLAMKGAAVETAHTAADGAALAQRVRPDVLLLDIGLPDGTGNELAQRLRAEPWGRDAVFVAITGWGQKEDRAKTSDAGFDAHFVKPVDPVQVLDLLAGVRPRVV